MSRAIQALLSSSKNSVKDPLWDDKPNSWIRLLGARASARTAQLIVSLAVQGSINDDPSAGFKVVAGDSLIEVKLATLGLMSGYPSLMWQRIRLTSDFTHLCLIAVYPDDARMFLVPKAEIDSSTMSPVKGTVDNFQLTTRRTDALWPWLVRHELGRTV